MGLRAAQQARRGGPPGRARFKCSATGYEPAAVDHRVAWLTARLQQTRARVDELESRARGHARAAAPGPESAIVAARLNSIMRAAERDREGRLTLARAAADAERADARREAAAVLAQADDEAQVLTAAAWAMHHRLVARSCELAEEVRSGAAALAGRIGLEAEEILLRTRRQAVQLAMRSISLETAPAAHPSCDLDPDRTPRPARLAPVTRRARMSL
jgi:hypothetical protein